MSNKPGRNDPCPCGSGRKFKKCHGAISVLDRLSTLNSPRGRREIQSMLARHEAEEFQRREQQGLGKPIISTEFQNHRFVAVGSTLHFSKKWQTFHDFLNDYPKIVLGKDWWMSEIAKPPKELHRILTWAVRSSEHTRAHIQHHGPGKPQPMTGAIGAYMRLAYDLYGLKHAVNVQALLINRIKHSETFPGALYEVRVAAALLRAGFTLQLQDETDRRTTHVEFVATHTESGATYSVEAKRREGVRMKINKQMYRALSKQSDHPRIVFIDTNDGRLELGRNRPNPVALVEAEGLLDRYEHDPTGKSLPPAYVIVTFEPEEHHLDAVDLPSGMLLWGFHIPDLKPGLKTLSQQVEMRKRHAPIFALMESVQKHRKIPATFDGEADASLGTAHKSRLQIGQRLDVTGPDGAKVETTLEGGVVMSSGKAATCVVCTDDQKRFMVQIPLTDEDLQAYAQHPTTFFGVIDRNAGRPMAKTALDWFNFLWEAYALSSKEKLLEFMKQAPDIELLKRMSQDELATEYCTRMAVSMMQQQAAAPTAQASDVCNDATSSIVKL
jgi:hypothetical protein